MISAAMLTAISSGVWLLIGTPMGAKSLFNFSSVKLSLRHSSNNYPFLIDYLKLPGI